METTHKANSVIVNNSIAINRLSNKLKTVMWITSITAVIAIINLIGICLLIGGLLTIDAKIE